MCCVFSVVYSAPTNNSSYIGRVTAVCTVDRTEQQTLTVQSDITIQSVKTNSRNE